MFLIDAAWAQVQSGPASGGMFEMLMSIAPMIALMALGYFFLIRPQQKQAQERKRLLEALKVGDQVVTAGGLIGKIHQMTAQNIVLLELTEGVLVKTLRQSITEKLNSSDAEKLFSQKSSSLKAALEKKKKLKQQK